MDLYIFRHGTTYFSKTDIPYGDKMETAEILPEAYAPIEKLADYLKDITTGANYSSPYKRCVQTVQIVEKTTQKKFTFDDRLKDWYLGKETINTMLERITNFYGELGRSNYKSVAICTHGYPINALISLITKGHVARADLENYPDPGVLVVIKDKKVEYLDFNQ